jgi:hypothetical protein
MERRHEADVQATFIVRLRHEPGTPGGEWRGEVEHVQSARRTRVGEQASLGAFIWSELASLELDPRRTGSER